MNDSLMLMDMGRFLGDIMRLLESGYGWSDIRWILVMHFNILAEIPSSIGVSLI
jgi:hypothetical protein